MQQKATGLGEDSLTAFNFGTSTIGCHLEGSYIPSKPSIEVPIVSSCSVSLPRLPEELFSTPESCDTEWSRQ